MIQFARAYTFQWRHMSVVASQIIPYWCNVEYPITWLIWRLFYLRQIWGSVIKFDNSCYRIRITPHSHYDLKLTVSMGTYKHAIDVCSCGLQHQEFKASYFFSFWCHVLKHPKVSGIMVWKWLCLWRPIWAGHYCLTEGYTFTYVMLADISAHNYRQFVLLETDTPDS